MTFTRIASTIEVAVMFLERISKRYPILHFAFYFVAIGLLIGTAVTALIAFLWAVITAFNAIATRFGEGWAVGLGILFFITFALAIQATVDSYENDN